MQFSKTRKCEQCMIATPLETLKLFPSKDSKGYAFLCKECGEQLKKRASSIAGSSAPRASTAKEQQKEALVCQRCNYKFKANFNKAGISYGLCCPYCGRKDQLRIQKGSMF